ncbi:hypothetical protein GWK26_11265 [haloarchaeon 3A1-DGR]|nr:hypothetical protein GWK26_11265 [haloarchaeon 3A1-DGR]
MALQLGRTFSDGIRRVVTRTGALLLAMLLAVQFLVQTAINTVVIGLLPPEAAAALEGMLGLTLPVSAGVAGALLVVGIVAGAASLVVLSRALTRPIAELSTVPSRLFTRRPGRATLSMLVGGVLIAIAVTIGTAFLFVPGIFLSVCFMFFVFAVGVEDRGIVGGLKRSWGLSRGNRLKLAVFVVVAAVIGGLLGIVGSVLDLANAPVLAEVVTNTLGSVLFLLLYGAIAEAYLQVREDGPGGSGRAGPTGSGTASPTRTDGVEL